MGIVVNQNGGGVSADAEVMVGKMHTFDAARTVARVFM